MSYYFYWPSDGIKFGCVYSVSEAVAKSSLLKPRFDMDDAVELGGDSGTLIGHLGLTHTFTMLKYSCHGTSIC